jgi:hypothetical protein
MIEPKQCARHRRLKLIRHPMRRVRIQFAWPIDEAARAPAPIDKPLYKPCNKQGDTGHPPASMCIVVLSIDSSRNYWEGYHVDVFPHS